MALILHLTDLHLDARAGRGIISDVKVSVLEDRVLQKRLSALGAALSSLRGVLKREQKSIDSIVITGDITHGGEPAGFDLLTGVLEHLADKLPDRSRILIVPGNHDVVRGTKSSTKKRYSRFLKLRDEGYLTAWLEGVDIDADGQPLPGASDAPILIGMDESFVLVGVNSSNHSGSTRANEPNLAKHLPALRRSDDEGVKALVSAWEKRGEDDIARVDRAQRIALARLLAQATLPHRAARIAAFHHHLYPVGDVEEIKAFETMTNLGEFQDWLASNDIAIALHGHKHVSRVGKIAFTPNGRHSEHHMLVVSGPHLEEKQSNKQPIGRLIEINPDFPRGRPITLTEVPAASEGTELVWSDLVSLVRDTDDLGRGGELEGQNVTEVHNKLLALADRYDQLPSPLICRIFDGESCREAPAQFPDYLGDEEPSDWFKEIVEWWQRPTRGRAASFNHGERLYSYGPEKHDQVDEMVRELAVDKETSRAMATLIYPERDLKLDAFPSFAMVHVLQEDDRLDVVAYYRKQEMPHWWRVNVAELAEIQAAVLRGVGNSALRPGSITTITGRPTDGKSMPRVGVPWIDREADTGRLGRMVAPLFSSDVVVSDVLPLWTRVFSDWVPKRDEQAADGDPLPSIGIQGLVDEISTAAATFKSTTATSELRKSLRALVNVNLEYSTEPDLWLSWATEVRNSRDEILELVAGIVAERGDSDQTSAK